MSYETGTSINLSHLNGPSKTQSAAGAMRSVLRPIGQHVKIIDVFVEASRSTRIQVC